VGAKSVVVAGAGGNIGSHAVLNLGRAPEVARITLIDRDRYEHRNLLNQNILPRDVGQWKAVVLARRLLEIRPDLEVRIFHAPLENLPGGVFRADLIVSCLDSRAARQALQERAWRMGSVLVDSGVMGSESLARVNVYTPAADMPCLECAWSEEDYRMAGRRYLCSGTVDAPAPNGASCELGALAGAMLAIESRKMLAGEFDCAAIGRQVTLNARWHGLTVTSFRRNPRCRFDHAVWRVEPLRCDIEGTRIADLLDTAPSIRVPGHRFVRRLICLACREEKRLFHLDASLDGAARGCARCQLPMVAAGFDIVESLDRNLPADVRRRSLAEAGLRVGEVLQAGDRFFEILANPVIGKGI